MNYRNMCEQPLRSETDHRSLCNMKSLCVLVTFLLLLNLARAANNDTSRISSSFEISGFKHRIVNDRAVLEWEFRKLINGELELAPELNLYIYTMKSRYELMATYNAKLNNKTCPPTVHTDSNEARYCQFTIPLKQCEDYRVRAEHDSYKADVFFNTVEVASSSFQADLTGDADNPVKLSWTISCDQNTIAPISFLFINQNKKTENLITFTNATCIAKKCSIRVPRSFFLPCTEYAITMMQTGKNETRKITSPPVVVGLKAQKLPFENKFQLLWTMREVALCTAGHFALEVRKENVANKQSVNYVLQEPTNKHCNLSGCIYELPITPCLSYTIRASSTESVKLFIQNFSNLTAKGTSEGNPEITLAWKPTCIEQDDATAPVPFFIKDEANSNNNATIMATCEGSNELCTFSITSKNLQILPCSSYLIKSDGPSNTTVKIAPRQGDLEINGASIFTKADFRNGLLVNVTVGIAMHYRCVGQLDAAQIQMQLSHGTHLIHTIPCNRSRVCSKIVPSTDIANYDICQPSSVQMGWAFLSRIYEEGRAPSVVLYNTTIPPSMSDKQTGEPIQLEQRIVDNQPSLELRWSDPACQISVISAWKIFIIGEQSYKIDVPYSCSTTPGGSVKQKFVQLINGRVASCPGAQVQTTPFEMTSCSNYSVNVIPISGGLPRPYFALQTRFTTPFYSQSIKSFHQVAEFTATSFRLTWSVPGNCEDSIQKETKVEVDGALQVIRPPDLIIKRENGTARAYWSNPQVLSSCTTYRVQVGSSATQNITTMPDKENGVVKKINILDVTSNSAKISWSPPECSKATMMNWRVVVTNDPNLYSALINVTVPSSETNFNIEQQPVASNKDGKSLSTHRELEPCKTYFVMIGAQWSEGTLITSSYEKFSTRCPHNLVVVLTSVILVLLAIGLVMVGIMIYRNRKGNGMTQPFIRVELNDLTTSPIMGTLLPKMNNHRPLSILDLCHLSNFNKIKRDFLLLKSMAEIEMAKRPQTIASRPINKIKNRFINIHPYDSNRVVLSILDGDPNSDYINASYIPGINRKNEYIAAQGPKEETVNDFWRMIWEHNVQLIVMVTSLKENGNVKCEKYWPEKDIRSKLYGEINVTMSSEKDASFYTIRNFNVTKSDGKMRLKQLHFTAWPDFGSPENPEELIQFIGVLREEANLLNRNASSPSPVLVHCSAGVGRTGTLIAIDYLIQKMHLTDQIDILNAVLQFRRFRVSMVQSESQYVFVHQCLAHYAKTRLGSGEANQEEPIYENTLGEHAVGEDPMGHSLLCDPVFRDSNLLILNQHGNPILSPNDD